MSRGGRSRKESSKPKLEESVCNVTRPVVEPGDHGRIGVDGAITEAEECRWSFVSALDDKSAFLSIHDTSQSVL